MKLSEELINQVRSEASISTVIGHYIPLIKKGKGYTALCPFHDDHDPSLSISEDKQIYKCFVCGDGGNVFTFVQHFKKISFPESVVEVSKIIGKPINVELDNKPKIVSKFQKDYDLLNDMISHTNYLLTGAKVGMDAKQYLINRGIEEDVMNHFSIGYNPKDNFIYKYLNSKGYSDELMIKTYVCRMNNNGMSDIFYDRILFPIHDNLGRPVAFTARSISKDAVSKYINSSDTEIYNKGNYLYNHHRVIEDVKKLKSVLVVEGVMDVIAYYRADINNVVATLGTACSKRQLELLKSLSNNLVLSYDGDEAGINANLKLGEMALKEGMNVQVIDNNTELDPDEIIAKYGKNALRDLSSKRVSYIDYALNKYKKRVNLNNFSDRKKLHEKMLSLISLLKDQDEIENYLNTLSDITKINKRISNINKKEYNDKVIQDKVFDYDGLTMAEYTILSQMALSYKAVSIFQKDLGGLLDDDNQYLALSIIDAYRKDKTCQLSKLYDEIDNDNIKQLIVNLSMIEILPDHYDEDILSGAIKREKQELKKHRLQILKENISKTEVVSKEETEIYLEEYTKLLKELKENYH